MFEDVRRAHPACGRKAACRSARGPFKSEAVPTDPTYMDVPVGQFAGVSPHRERLWGVVGGLIGSLVGVGGLLVVFLVQETPLRELWGAPYPPLFMRRSIIPLDYYFLGLVALGLVFLESGVIALRFSRFPRTDGAGAALLGTVLCALGGVVLFVRLWAVVHG